MPDFNPQKVAKNTSYLFIRMILVLFVTLYTSKIVLRTLGFEDFGIYNVVGSVVVFLGFFQTALNNATYRYLAYELGTGNIEKLKKVYAMAINCHFLLALIFFILLEIGGFYFVNYYLDINPTRLFAAKWVFQFSLMTFCFNVIRTPFNSNIIAHEHMNFYALISIVEVILKLLVVYALVLSSLDKLIVYAVLLMFVSFIIFVWYVIYCRLQFKECRYSFCWENKLLKQFVSYSGWSLLVNATDMTTVQCLSILFFKFLGAISNAALAIAYQVLGAFNMLLSSFTQAYNPQIIKQYAAGNDSIFMQIIYSSSKLSYFLISIPAIPIFLNAEFVLQMWLGDYPLMAPSFIRMIILYILIDAFQSPLWQAVHATGNIKTHQEIMSIIKVLAIPLIYLILKNGLSGIFALSVWAFLNALCAIVRTFYMRHLINLDVFRYFQEVIIRILFVTLLALSISIIIKCLLPNNIYGVICSILSSISFVVLFICLFGMTSHEKRFFLSLPFVQKIMCLIR